MHPSPHDTEAEELWDNFVGKASDSVLTEANEFFETLAAVFLTLNTKQLETLENAGQFIKADNTIATDTIKHVLCDEVRGNAELRRGVLQDLLLHFLHQS